MLCQPHQTHDPSLTFPDLYCRVLLLNSSPIPLYIQLSDLFRQRVARGIWPTGSRIPSLEKIMEEFSVSRMTVRQAVDVLSREGLLTAERGRGTFVNAAPVATRWLKLETSLSKLADVYRDTRPTLLDFELECAPPPLLPEDGKPAASYTYMKRLHSHDDRPYSLISIYVASDIYSIAPERFRNETVLSVMEELPQVKIARARQTLTITTADMDVASQLQIPINSPVADVRRLFCDPEGRVIYLSLITYRGDFVRLEMDLKP